ncbi:MAG TPA: DUF2865 domain-containing protein [Hyphomicrobiaceae bacterium]|nr:DUF2865 domain-containing protein [Hyphomicrobiaceae bacterium]
MTIRPRTKAVAGFSLLLALAAPLAMPQGSAVAQGWWPWANPDRPPVPREPMWRPNPQQQPAPIPAPNQPGAPQAPLASRNANPICLQLEQRLVAESQRGNVSREMLPRIESDIRQADRASQVAQAQLDRGDCYDYFLFSKTLRRTRQCVDLANQAEAAKRKVAELDAQRQQILGSRDRSYQDDIIRELARNNCGANYQQEAQRRGGFNPFSSLWQDEDSGAGGGANQFGALPFATYRTLCVRLCDGFYFPVSFSTLPNHFQRDAEVCQSRCAAPAELYYYQNPGGAVEQMVSANSQQPYTSLKSAFRYRKEYVPGCSCKQAEYSPSAGERPDRKAEAPPQQPTKQAQRQ